MTPARIKDKTKITRFMFECLRQCTIFCCALIHFAEITERKRFHWLVPQSVLNNNYFFSARSRPNIVCHADVLSLVTRSFTRFVGKNARRVTNLRTYAWEARPKIKAKKEKTKNVVGRIHNH